LYVANDDGANEIKDKLKWAAHR